MSNSECRMSIVDIVVALYGDRGDLDRLTKSIEEHCYDYNLIVIDNNPPNENKGFTKANNEGILKGTSEFIWLLNQDAIVLPRAQYALIDRFSYGKQVGIVGSMQRDYDDQDIIRHGGTLRAFPAGAHAGGRVSMGHCNLPSKQTWVNFASVMLRREMVNTIGPLDESMFLVYSDSDYCYYVRSKEYEVWYEPRSQVLHRLNVSKKPGEWHQKDMKAFMKKWGIVFVGEVEGQPQFRYSPEFAKLNEFP